VASDDPITLLENNDETVAVFIEPQTAGSDLTAVASLQFILKHDRCDPDDAATNLTLHTGIPAEMVFITQTADLIEAEAYIPSETLAGSFPRWYRVDTLTAGGDRRTAVYGRVTVTNT
jgi:hypothetical protein